MLLPVHFESQRFGLAQQVTPIRESRSTDIPPGNGHALGGSQQVVLSSFDLTRAEALLIARALEVTAGNRTRAAELLGVSVRTLRNKLNAVPRS